MKPDSSGRDEDLKLIPIAEKTVKNLVKGDESHPLTYMQREGFMKEESFKSRIKLEIMKFAKLYKRMYLDYEYLICSEAFVKKDFYIIKAEENNFQHLTGVHSLIKPTEFFRKAYNDILDENDFDFIKRGQSEKMVKGLVRRKMKASAQMFSLFDESALAEENFIKNSIHCSFATADYGCTLGFVNVGKARPQTLLKGNGLNLERAKSVDVVLRKKTGAKYFSEIVYGEKEMIEKYKGKLKKEIELAIKPFF